MRGFGGVSRRNMLIGGVAAPFIGVAGTGPVRAAAPMLGGAMAPFHRFALGGFEVTTLLAGTRTVDNPHGIFGMNVSDEAFDEAAQAAFPSWSARTAKDRAQVLQRWFRLILDNQEELARLLTLEQGKSLAGSRGGLRERALRARGP